MLKFIKYTFLFIGLILLFSHCEEREWNSPFDTAMDPELWKPTNLKVVKKNLTSADLSWQKPNVEFEGFKIDRKIGEGTWQTAYQNLGKTASTFTDTDVLPDVTTIYHYRVYAFAGENNSTGVEFDYLPEFPAPTIRGISFYSSTQIKINWEYAESGVESYQLTYKNDIGEWNELESNIPLNRHYCFDNSFNNLTRLSYRVYAKYKGLISEYAEVDIEDAL